jgi:transketolase
MQKEVQRRLAEIAGYVRYLILVSTFEAGSGHPTSSLSATDLMTGLMFGGSFRYDVNRPEHPNNDRLIFSKGHAAPLLYALWVAAGKVTEDELLTLRRFDSPFEGHPTANFRYAEAATGSLGQGLSIGVGTALNAKYVDALPYRTYILLGDSELAEGSQWEAIQLGAHYHLDNLIGIIDVNRLGQRGETMYGNDLSAYERRLQAFGWHTIVIDGHDLAEICGGYEEALGVEGKPIMIIAKTIKGKGVSVLQDQNGWHGKPLGKEVMSRALRELGDVDKSIRGQIPEPDSRTPAEEVVTPGKVQPPTYKIGQAAATRKAYGNALKRIYPMFPDMVVLDGEVSNSTYSDIFKGSYPERFFEMYIAEQNMVGAALGFSGCNKIPFVSTFAAFMTRAFDQIRMSQYSRANIKFCGSHAGVAIGEDGPSQMGLEDLAMFRTILDGAVLYPSDAVATEKLVLEAAKHPGVIYIRTTRNPTPVIYSPQEEFPIGGCKIVKESRNDLATIVAAGITLHEALAAFEELKTEGIQIRVIDLYTIKPIDQMTLRSAAQETKGIITVEDHFAEGGLGEAVTSALARCEIPVYSLAVRKMPKSGKPQELLDFEEISKNAIIRSVKTFLK